MAVLEKIIANQ